ncbi:phage tail tape measure protein [Subtercola sp. RTI3]|uniref:phage tail tape measure protein n=1 Tax=Subtercola sp. RTI3 TaxID=3048639 RepID=UPI002B235AA6|nr:phage tail tape measure protein [Subtercola sp. RTI3]MEA9986257.1 phage tail tape measure protein [Subtercola sp. RTI3]
MAANENIISILIAAKDEASAVIASAAAKSKAATAELNASSTETSSVSSGLNDVLGKTALVAGVAAVAIGVVAVKAAGDYQAALTRLVTSAGETESNLKLISSGILDVANSTGTSTTQLTDAMYTIESAGQHGADGLLVLKAAAQGAKEENASVETVADAVSSALQDYHLKATDAAQVTSTFVSAISQGKTTFEAFAGSLSSVLPIASAAHVSLVDISAAIASMTVHGMSADQATQDLAHSIGKMQSPTQQMTNYLAQLGITSSELSTDLGSKGITGTLQLISDTIMQKMGPSGKVLIDSMNQSKIAVSDAKTMIASMPPSLQKLAQNFFDGKVTVADYRKEMKELPVDQANLLAQFSALTDRAHGFNSLLKSGSPEAKTYAASLYAATGDATTLNTALMLTGENTDYVNNAVKAVSAATVDASGNVRGWSEVQNNFNQKMSQAGEVFQTDAIKLGTVLLPALTSVVGGFLAVNNAVQSFTSEHSRALQVALTTLGVALGTFAIGNLVSGIYGFITAGGIATTVTRAWAAALALLSDINPVVLGLTILAGAVTAFSMSTSSSKTTSDSFSNALKNQKDAQEALTNATNAAKTAQDELAHAQLQQQQNSLNVELDQKALNDAIKQYGANSIEARQATLNLKLDQLALKDSNDALAKSVENATQKLTDQKVAQNDAFTTTNTLNASVDKQAESYNNLTTALGNTKTALQNVSGGSNPVTGTTKQAIPGLKLPGQKFATGTNYAPGGTALVGEQGPEIVNLPRGSQVKTASQTRKALGGGASITIANLNINNQMDEQKFLAKLGWRLSLQ